MGIPRSDLAVRTEEGAPAGSLLTDDRPTTAGTSLAFAAVDLVEPLEVPHASLRVPVLKVRKSGPSVLDRVPDDPGGRAPQPARLARAQIRSQAIVAQPGTVQDLVRVDVADPRQKSLIEEKSFQPGAPPGKQLGERRDGGSSFNTSKPRWVSSGISPRGPAVVTNTSPKVLGSTNLSWEPPEKSTTMWVWGATSRWGRPYSQLPAHSQVDHHRVRALRPGDQVLAETSDRRQGPFLESGDHLPRFGVPADSPRSADGHPFDGLTSERLVQVATDGLHLWQLGQASAPPGSARLTRCFAPDAEREVI